jgi:hypothetical protein
MARPNAQAPGGGSGGGDSFPAAGPPVLDLPGDGAKMDGSTTKSGKGRRSP